MTPVLEATLRFRCLFFFRCWSETYYLFLAGMWRISCLSALSGSQRGPVRTCDSLSSPQRFRMWETFPFHDHNTISVVSIGLLGKKRRKLRGNVMFSLVTKVKLSAKRSLLTELRHVFLGACSVFSLTAVAYSSSSCSLSYTSMYIN